MKFIRDIISEKRAQSAGAAASSLAGASAADRPAYLLTPDTAVDASPRPPLRRPPADAFAMLEDDEPDSILTRDAGAPDLRDVRNGATGGTARGATYDVDFGDTADFDHAEAADDDLDADFDAGLGADFDSDLDADFDDDFDADFDDDFDDDQGDDEAVLEDRDFLAALHAETAEQDAWDEAELDAPEEMQDFGSAPDDAQDAAMEPEDADNIFVEDAAIDEQARDTRAGWTGALPPLGEPEEAPEFVAEAEDHDHCQDLDDDDDDDQVGDVEGLPDAPREAGGFVAGLRAPGESPRPAPSMPAPSMQESIARAVHGERAEGAPARGASLLAGLPPMPETRRAAMPAEGAGQPVDVPAPAAGRANRRAGRVKTRLLGFNGAQAGNDPFASGEPGAAQPRPFTEFPVGWLIVVDGPGRGCAFTLHDGVAQIGRGEGQAVRLDFGDTSISRENHAAIAYDPEARKFYLGHGGKANLVRLNNRPVLSTEELHSGNLIRIGETTIRFVALCGADFDWSAGQQDGQRHVSAG